MTQQLSRALPGENVRITTDPWTEPFWLAAKEDRLTAAQCEMCETFRMPPTPFCPHCQSQATRWPRLSGKGSVYSFAVCNRSPFTGEEYIYVPVVIELDDAPGIRLVSNLVGVLPEDVKIGMAVQVTFNPITDGWKLPVFEVAK